MKPICELMLIELLILLTSSVFLAYSSEWFTDGASKLARIIGASEFLIGMTVVAIGTSLPEITVSAYASSTGDPGLAVGDVIGSNITNIALVLGAACLFHPFIIDSRAHRDAKIHVLILAVISCGLLYTSRITRLGGLLLIIAYGVYIWDGYIRHRSLYAVPAIRGKSFMQSTLQTVLAGVGVLVAGKFLVGAAIDIATELGISATIIGLTIVALGTSLPELTVSIAAARKKRGMMVIGNVIGSNIANILLALGVGATICTIPLTDGEVIVNNIVLMVFLAMAMVIFMRYRGIFDRRVGLLFIMVYAAFISMSFM